MSAGKGDKRRPYDIEKWNVGWERTFGSGKRFLCDKCKTTVYDSDRMIVTCDRGDCPQKETNQGGL